MTAFPKDVKLVFKQFPLPMHKEAKLAAQASLAANAQGKFWLLHDKMFGNFRQINRDNVLAWAKELGLDVEKFTKDLDDPKTAAAVEKDMEDGKKAGVQGTPSYFVNGKRYNGARTLDAIKPIIEADLKGGAAKPEAAKGEATTKGEAPKPKAAAPKAPAPAEAKPKPVPVASPSPASAPPAPSAPAPAPAASPAPSVP